MRGIEVILCNNSIKKPVLMGIPPLFLLFLLPCLMDTLHVWYHWIGILIGHLGMWVSRLTDHLPSRSWTFTETSSWLHISDIPTFCPRLPFSVSPQTPTQSSCKFSEILPKLS